MIEYEDLRLKIKLRMDVHDLVDLLDIEEDDILDEFKDRVMDNIEKIYEQLEYNEAEGEFEE